MKTGSALAFALGLAGCSLVQPAPRIITKTDTLVVTREVPPALEKGDSVDICLSTGVTAHVHITAQGDTLIGDARVRVRALRPVLAFAGAYASDAGWFTTSDTLRFEKRLYRKAGAEMARGCDELKLVGSYAGVPVFAEVTAPQALPRIMIPVRPGRFQPYQTNGSSATSRGRRR